MGIFKFLKSKLARRKDIDQPEASQSQKGQDSKTYGSEFVKSNLLNFIKNNGKLYEENEKQIREARSEYQTIASYLADIQKIEMIPSEYREDLDNAARNIVRLNRERLERQNRDVNITDIQYQLFESYELQIPKDLVLLKEEEDYKKDIERDIEHLENEREKLNTDEEEIISKQAYLKGLGIAIFTVTIVLFALFAIILYKLDVDLTLPFLLTILIGMISTLYIFMESRKNTHDIKLVSAKINRQIQLMNRVKIKAFNNHNYLQYIYNKYMVVDYNHLKELWEEYITLKEESLKYKDNTEQLDYYCDILVNELDRFGINDKEIWIYQAIALIDSREMVEVRHRLNERRRSLREQIEVYQEQQEEAIDIITKIVEANPDKKEEASKLLKSYNISE